MLCLSSEFAETELTFTRYINALSHIAANLRKDPERIAAYQRIADMVLCEALQQLAPLWVGLNEWMTLIEGEMAPADSTSMVGQWLPDLAELSVKSSPLLDPRRWSFKSEKSMSQSRLLAPELAATMAAEESSSTDSSQLAIAADPGSPLAARGTEPGAQRMYRRQSSPEIMMRRSQVGYELLSELADETHVSVDDFIIAKSSSDSKSIQSLPLDLRTSRPQSLVISDDVTLADSNVLSYHPPPPSEAEVEAEPSLMDVYIHRLASVIKGYYLCEQILWFEALTSVL